MKLGSRTWKLGVCIKGRNSRPKTWAPYTPSSKEVLLFNLSDFTRVMRVNVKLDPFYGHPRLSTVSTITRGNVVVWL